MIVGSESAPEIDEGAPPPADLVAEEQAAASDLQTPEITPSSGVLDADDEEDFTKTTAWRQDEQGRIHPSEVVMALARAARSVVTYDARNQTVRRLIDNYQKATAAALSAHGALTMEVRPFEFAWSGEVIYRELDRERSLAFRLFRDGIRELTIQPEVEWDDLLKLLEILSVRYVGVRQQEDDTLTLLRQANFERITFVVVETYVPAEENPEHDAVLDYQAEKVPAPKDWDMPLPRLGSAAPLAYRKLSDDEVSRLLTEASPKGLVDVSVQVVKEVLTFAESTDDEALQKRLIGLIAEICGFLVVELRSPELVWVVRQTQHRLGDLPGASELAERFAGGDVLDRFLRDPDDVDIDDVMPLFALCGSVEHLNRVIDRFAEEEDETARRALKLILSRLAVNNPDALLARLGDVPVKRVVDLFNVVCVVAPMERTMEAAFSLVGHPSLDVKLGALEVLAAAPASKRLEQALLPLLLSETPRLRMRAAAIVGQRCGGHGFTALRDLLERLDKKDQLEPIEAGVLGQAMVKAARQSAIPLLRSWIRPKGVKGMLEKFKLSTSQRMRRFAAVAGLATDTSAESIKLVSWLSQRADDELAERCKRALTTMEPGT